MSRLLVYGAGGHGKVVADCACESGNWDQIAFIDQRYPELSLIEEWPVVGIELSSNLCRDYSDVAIAVGDNIRRLELMKSSVDMGFNLPVIIHPSSIISKYAAVGHGTVLMAGTVVNAGVTIGEGCIINTGATIDHDCKLSNGVHVSPGAHLAGGVSVGDASWIGVGSCVRELVTIGSSVTVGAGAVLLCDVEDGFTVFGVPAKPVEIKL